MNVEDAYQEIQKRGWGFASDGEGFGDPSSTWTAVGPMVNGMVEIYFVHKDPIKAVEMAILKEEENG